MTGPKPIRTQALVIGAGPVGLFQVFQLGLQGMQAHVVDALPHAGGQPVELYPDKAIYDIPGLPVCTGQSLTDALLAQIAPFNTPFHWGQEVSTLSQQPDGQWALGTSLGTQFVASTVFIAAGVGAFQPKRLKLDGLNAFEGSQLLYRIRQPERLAGQQVVVVGGDDTALEWALRLSTPGPHQAASVVLVHRRDAFQAQADTVAAVRARCASGGLRFVVGQITGYGTQANAGPTNAEHAHTDATHVDPATLAGPFSKRITSVHITDPDEQVHTVPADALAVFLGLSPQLGPVAQWGLAMQRKQLVVDPATFCTAAPGLYAVGDVITYPGKRKLMVCGFHECTLAAYAAAAALRPGAPLVQQYTSSSAHLQSLLGVGQPAKAHPSTG